MKLRAELRLDLPSDMAERIIALSGAAITDPMDQRLAILSAAFRQLPGVIRDLLLSPEHVPMQPGIPYRFSADSSAVTMLLTIHPDPQETASP